MASTTIELNGNTYVLANNGAIRQSYVQRLGANYRTVGVQRREDDASVNRYIHRNFLKGFGPDRINRETGEGLGHFRDATCMTHWASGVYLPLLAQNSTEPTGVTAPTRIAASTTFNGNLWGLFEDDNATPAIVARRYAGSTTSWEGGGTLAAASPQAPLDIMSFRTGMIALIAASASQDTYTSTDGVTWTITATDITAGLLANNVGTNEESDFGLLIEVLGEKVAVVWDEVSGTITFFSGTTLTGAWTDEAVDIPSGNGPQGVAVYPDIDGQTYLWVGTREGLWRVDTTTATWGLRKVLDVPSSNDNFRRMTVHQGKLWFGLGVDNNSPAPIWTMETRGDQRIFDTKAGLDQASGLPAEMMGPVRWMKSARNLLFASIGGGAASRNGRVIVHNGVGWHSSYRNGTANQQIRWIDVSSDDDGTLRLHFALRVSAGESDTQFLANPLVDPASDITLAYATSGYLRMPDDDLGDPQTNATIFQALVDADDLSASTAGEYIQHQYGLDGASDTTTNLGNYLSGDKDLSFGASSQGVAGLRIANRLTFNRDAGSTAESPKLREFEIQASKRLLTRRAWDFAIDIEATARETPPTRAANLEVEETIIDNLQVVAEATTMVTFTTGRDAQVRVQVPNDMKPDFQLVTVGSDRGNRGYRTGFVAMHVEEGI